MQHLKRSHEMNIANADWSTKELAKKHEDLKHAIGFYDADFSGDQEAKAKEKTYREGLWRDERGRQDPALGFSQETELPGPIDLVGEPGIVQGSSRDLSGDLHGGKLKVRSAPDNLESKAGADVHPRFQNVIQKVAVPEENRMDGEGEVHPDLADDLEVVPIPGTDGGLLGQGNRLLDKLPRK